MFEAKVVDNFLSKEEVEKILALAKSVEEWEREPNGSFWDNRGLEYKNIYYNYNAEIGKLLYEIKNKIKLEIEKLYRVDEAYCDHLAINRWFSGMEQPPHADDMKNAGPGHDWFHHRHFGAIIYLNNDYVGGQTYYPQQNFNIDPIPGRLAIHPGNEEHLHGVSKISGNTRYTVASFWTKDKKYNDNWTIH